jgi:hypothetical protein
MLNMTACRKQRKCKVKALYASHEGVWGVKLLLLSFSDLTLNFVSGQLHATTALTLRNATLVPLNRSRVDGQYRSK